MNSQLSVQTTNLDRARIRDEATAWFARAQMDSLGAEEKAQFEVWMALSQSHRAAYWRLEGAWEEAERLTALREAKSAMPYVASRNIPVWAKVVAAFALVALSVGTAQVYLTPHAAKAYATDLGGRKVLKLADGSQIELNTNTSIRLAITADTRTVWLDKGEAYFQIAHDASRPFAVIAGSHRIIDLGTKFIARQKSDALEVSLVEGRARVEVTGITRIRSADLAPGDVAVASATAISVTHQSTGLMNNQLGWRHGVLIFKSTTMAKAVAEMNRYNTEKLVVSDTSLGQQTIDGTFPVHSVQQFSEMAQAVFGLRIEKHGTETILTR